MSEQVRITRGNAQEDMLDIAEAEEHTVEDDLQDLARDVMQR